MFRVCVTGGCGFVGSHLVNHLLLNTDWEIDIIDRLNYASTGFDRIRDINVFDEKRVRVFTHDFTLPIKNGFARELGQYDYIFHIGAESHVDRSIEDSEPFVTNNILGTQRLLEFARGQEHLKWFVMFSTDEVYGPAPDGVDYREFDRFNPTNPYAATKAGAECLAMSYANCYKLPVMITNSMNILGERQHPEKFLPKIINAILAGGTVTIHSDPSKTKAGRRKYIHARNVASALLFLVDKVEFSYPPYELENIEGMRMPIYKYRYNVVGEKEIDNLSLAKFVAETLGKPLKYEMVNFHESRPGHDLRYSLDNSKLKGMGFEYPKTFEESLKKMVLWMVSKEHERWLKE